MGDANRIEAFYYQSIASYKKLKMIPSSSAGGKRNRTIW